jgi:hypothetical protein
MPAKFPARLHVVLASEAPVGVIFRRGPSNAVCSVLWDRTKDEFQLGQWLRGRMYERRADLSPDGRHLIYFARSGGLSSPTRGSYTAISRAPWLKAIALFGKGDCWQGGGIFTSNSTYWLNGGGCHFPLQDTKEVHRDLKFKPVGMYGGECPGVYYVRLQRDGWILKDELTAGLSSAFAVFEKTLPHGWVLRKYAHAEVGAPPGKGCYWDEHELDHPKLGHRLLKPHWEWAELDGKTLVWAEKGQLARAPLKRDELGDAQILFDFNDMKFEPRTAPY